MRICVCMYVCVRVCMPVQVHNIKRICYRLWVVHCGLVATSSVKDKHLHQRFWKPYNSIIVLQAQAKRAVPAVILQCTDGSHVVQW